ncbi:hypothetical protein JZQ91_004404, partial [Salmonella enterica subsp. houtenae serovar 43:z4,z23:-]|nr:hypothetical protein [Salmonella enterica subsp. houtenae serovar Houten]
AEPEARAVTPGPVVQAVTALGAVMARRVLRVPRAGAGRPVAMPAVAVLSSVRGILRPPLWHWAVPVAMLPVHLTVEAVVMAEPVEMAETEAKLAVREQRGKPVARAPAVMVVVAAPG